MKKYPFCTEMIRDEAAGCPSGKGISGWVFVLCGAIIGTLVYIVLLYLFEDVVFYLRDNRHGVVVAVAGILFLFGGGCLGLFSHEVMKDRIARQQGAAEQRTGTGKNPSGQGQTR